MGGGFVASEEAVCRPPPMNCYDKLDWGGVDRWLELLFYASSLGYRYRYSSVFVLFSAALETGTKTPVKQYTNSKQQKKKKLSLIMSTFTPVHDIPLPLPLPLCSNRTFNRLSHRCLLAIQGIYSSTVPILE